MDETNTGNDQGIMKPKYEQRENDLVIAEYITGFLVKVPRPKISELFEQAMGYANIFSLLYNRLLHLFSS